MNAEKRFPNAGLEPFEATPRIRPESAAGIACDVDELRRLGVGDFGPTPAIVVVVWQGASVKCLVGEEEAQETIRRLTLRLQEAIANANPKSEIVRGTHESRARRRNRPG